MKTKINLEQNGFIKIKNQQTDIEVTFNIKTEQQARNLYRKKRKRWIKLGQVINGQVELTEYHASQKASRLYRNILNDPDRYSRFTYQHEARCNLCNRRLENTTSVWRGYGPKCAKKIRA